MCPLNGLLDAASLADVSFGISPSQFNPCCRTLSKVRIQDTNTTELSVAILLLFLPNLQSLGGFIYYRNVGDAILSLINRRDLSLNLSALWDTSLPPSKAVLLNKAAPRLTNLYTQASHLTSLAQLENITQLTLDFDFNNYLSMLEQYLAVHGTKLRKLVLVDQRMFAVDVGMLADTCPNLEELGATLEGGCREESQPFLPKLTTCRVRLGSHNTFTSLMVYARSLTTFEIKDIQETDAAFYQCQVIISLNNKITAAVDLQVRRPPIISDNSTRSLVVSEGQSVQLECYAGGYPPPRVSWRRENNAILPTGGSIYRGNRLKISTITKEDRGTYYCVAENGVGKGARRNIAVEVEFAPVITVPRPRLGQALQYDMDLECHVEAYPPPAIVWVKDEVQLSNNQHYSISHFATADEFTDTTIRVITIEKRQFGKYICRAANKLGKAEAEVELFESIIPVCPPACGQAHYGEAGQITTSMALVLISAFLVFIHRNLSAKY